MKIRRLILNAFLFFLLASGLNAEDGYRLWLRYDNVQDAQLRQQYAGQVSEIIVPGNSATPAVIREELHNGLSGLLSHDVPFGESVTRPGAVVVVTSSNAPLAKMLGLQTEFDLLGDEGYLLRTMTNAGRPVTVIAARGEMGALYGAFGFLRLLQAHRDISRLEIVEKPWLQRRMLDHWDNLNGSVERGYSGKSLWQWDGLPEKLSPRYKDYARANASLGLNSVVLNNVNSKPEQLNGVNLKKAAALANVFRPYGIRIYLTANFAAPKKLGGLSTANPSDLQVRRWWKTKADEIYSLIPDFGGFLVKANSEGQPGPQDYGLTHADGANMLAEALAPHGGIVMWRAFVYNSPKVDADRAKRAYLEFMPLDGKFASNVLVQVKNGPIDFQPREPFHPLFGAMKKTSLMAELEITQENMGHSTDLVYLAPMWKEFLEADTDDSNRFNVASTIAQSRLTAIAGVANAGNDRNWCGHDFAQANWYAFGRLAWNSKLSSDQIAEEWIRMTWSNDPQVVSTILKIMRGSWEACVNYEMPLGLHHLMDGGNHYDPKPETVNKKTPEYSAVYYHKADAKGVGFDRTASGSDAVGQYFPAIAERLSDLDTCPSELLLWFHHVSWDYRLHDGRTVWEELCFRYNAGVNSVKAMRAEWELLRGKIDAARFEAVEKKLDAQLAHAAKWRDVCLRYFQSINQKSTPDFSGANAQP